MTRKPLEQTRVLTLPNDSVEFPDDHVSIFLWSDGSASIISPDNGGRHGITTLWRFHE